MRVRFWGVRGSIPTPVTGEDISSRLIAALLRLGDSPALGAPPLDLTDREAVTQWVDALPPSIFSIVGGNTPCIEMTTDAGDLFIIDFGSGLRALSDEMVKGAFGQGKGHAHLFLSHFHWDHIQGWPFFKPAYIEGNQFDLYARHEGVAELLKKQQEPPFFPPAAWDEMHAVIRVHNLPESQHPTLLCDGRVRVTSFELDHPSRAFAFRFDADGKSFVYASDGAFPDPESAAGHEIIKFFRDADLLVFDAQFSHLESVEKHSWGHSSGESGVELACRAGAKRLALFHHAPGADEAHLETLLRAGQHRARHLAAPCLPGQVEVFLAREGAVIDL